MSYTPGVQQLDPTQLGDAHRKEKEGGAPKDGMERAKDLNKAAEEERQKNALTQLLMGAAGAQVGRGPTAYDMNMVNGRQGLVDPALTQQQTFRPMPWDERYASTANLMGIQNSTRLYTPSEQITSQVASLTPQMQAAIKPQHTIYIQTPDDWMTNRLNLALQRRRESSVYAIV